MPKAAAAMNAAVEILPLEQIAPNIGRPAGRAILRSEGHGMTPPTRQTRPRPASPATYPVMVLLVDDQLMVGEAVRRALLGRTRSGTFHYCGDPTKAIATAQRGRRRR